MFDLLMVHSRWMHNPLSVDEADLLGFFGVDPKHLDSDSPWAYNENVYEVRAEKLHLSFAIAPALRDVRVALTIDGILLYELNAVAVADLILHDDNGRTSLELLLSDQDSIWIRRTPTLCILQQFQR